MALEIRHSQHFKTPRWNQRIHYSKRERSQFRKLLKANYNYTNWGNNKHGFCHKIRSSDNEQIPNPITAYPPKIKPYQMSFIEHYGYLPKIITKNKGNKLSISHRCGCNFCINPKHLLIEKFKLNVIRKICHDAIDLLSKLKNRLGSAKYYYLTNSGCNCNPHCFKSFNQQ